MKQNYKLYVCALLLVGAVSMMTTGAHAAPKLTVLVVGLETDAASDAFATGIGYEVTQKGLYELVTAANNTAVAAKLTALRQQYSQGVKVDTVGLAAWGREKGLDFVQLVVESDCSVNIGTSNPVNGREQLSQVVSCGTEKYSGRSTYRTQFVSQRVVVEAMLEDMMVSVAGGVFEMGCKAGRDSTSDYACENAEKPLHYVRVNNFYIGKYVVTQKLWKQVMGDLPSNLKNDSTLLGDNKPAVYVNYSAITDTGGFLAKLNELTGKNYRLPREAEWEYAARGCTEGICDCESFLFSGSNNVDEVAWHSTNSSLHDVGQKIPNRLGLYDMSGNVWEWCSDWYGSYTTSTLTDPQDNPTGPNSSSNRIYRGGSFVRPPNMLRTAMRGVASKDAIFNTLGFRLVLP
jgi:formylglycine-generating enzyme required for sulfatase activity